MAALPLAAARRWTAVRGYACVLLALACALPLAPAIDARLLDLQFAVNRAWFPQPVRRDLVLVGINEAFLEGVEEPVTLSHRYLAQFLRGVGAAGPLVIGMDLVLPEKRYDQLQSRSDPEFDFHRTLLAGLLGAMQTCPVVAAKVWDHDRRHFRDIQLDYSSVLASQGEAVHGIASALFAADGDGRIRRYPDPALQPDRTPFTLSSEIAAAAGVRQPWSGLIDYQLGAPFQYIPLQDVLQLVREGRQDELARRFAGKAVLLGAVLDDIDLVELPVPLAAWLPGATRVPGMLAHAQAVRSMLNGGLIAPLARGGLWAGAAVMALFWFGARLRRKLALLSLLSLGLCALSTALLLRGVWLAPAAPLLGGWIALLARAGWQSWQQFLERQRLSRCFGGYVSPQVMQNILDGGIDARKSGRKLSVCVLFSDVRGFTGLSEALPAEQVVALLNRYFARMTAVVHRHGGTVDKFIGDGMMAFFGAPNEMACPEAAALAAAREMLAELALLNAESAPLGAPALRIGVGLHSGLAVIGYIGSAERHEYTAIGNTVNVAARIESLCKEVGMPVLCSLAVAERLAGETGLSDLGLREIKGHSPVHVLGWAPAQPG